MRKATIIGTSDANSLLQIHVGKVIGLLVSVVRQAANLSCFAQVSLKHYSDLLNFTAYIRENFLGICVYRVRTRSSIRRWHTTGVLNFQVANDTRTDFVFEKKRKHKTKRFIKQ